jgi:hypothetical protein
VNSQSLGTGPRRRRPQVRRRLSTGGVGRNSDWPAPGRHGPAATRRHGPACPGHRCSWRTLDRWPGHAWP